MLNDIGFLITCYRQLEYTCMNINQIRSLKNFKYSPIFVVSTCEDPGFRVLEKSFKNVHVIEYRNAPNEDNWFFLPTIQDSWRNRFLPPRILFSIQNGIRLSFCHGINRLIHLHSDTYWEIEKENSLIDIFEELTDYSIIGDLSCNEENTNTTPKGVCLHPEGLFFNLERCFKHGYGFHFWKIFKEELGFKTHNYGAIEPLLGQSLHWFLTDKNILTKDDKIEELYTKELKIIMKRDYHGIFDHGLVNLPGKQPND